MAQAHAQPAVAIDLNTFGGTVSTALVKTDTFEVIRLVVEPHKPIAPHRVAGPITIQCLSGRCTLVVDKARLALAPGSWLHLAGGTRHALQADETAVVLVTILFDKAD